MSIICVIGVNRPPEMPWNMRADDGLVDRSVPCRKRKSEASVKAEKRGEVQPPDPDTMHEPGVHGQSECEREQAAADHLLH